MSIKPIVDTRPLEPIARAAVVKRHPAQSRSKMTWRQYLAPLASMRLTVWLMVLAVFVILTFTFQLTRMDIWNAKSMHFPHLFVYIPLQTYLPPAWFPNLQNVGGGFYIPSGFLVLSALLINLVTAHLVRFRITGQGIGLRIGWTLLAAGAALSVLVVFAGQNPDGFQAQPLVRYSVLWHLIQVGLGIGDLYCLFCLVSGWKKNQNRLIERTLWFVAASLLTALCAFLLIKGQSAFIGDPAMRILWQLIQCAVPSLVILAGSRLVFGRKAGMVAIHAGIAILMLNEIYTSLTAVEQRIQFSEGQVRNFAYDLRHTELALVDSSDPTSEVHIVIPSSRLKPRTLINDENLPVDVMCVRYNQNSSIRFLNTPDPNNVATEGLGLILSAKELPPVSGTKSEIDRTTAYVKFTDRRTQRDLGTFLVGEQLDDIEQQTRNAPNVPKNMLQIGDRQYHVEMRFKRYYKPYRVKLLETEQQTYLGTSMARSYSSEFQLTDSETGLDVKEKVRMNNPLRYRNETFYQAGYDVTDDGTEVSTLQVVKNHGWMIPYFCCVLVGLGLLTHFSWTLAGFIKKANRQLADAAAKRSAAIKPDLPPRTGWRNPMAWMSVLVPISILAWTVVNATPTAVERDGMRFDQLGRLPIVHLGRAKPLETVARSLLRRCSGYEEIKKQDKDKTRIQPMVWLADAMLGGSEFESYELFRIDDPSLRNTLNLDDRSGYRYTLAEINKSCGTRHFGQAD